jgi:hypothetical protein
MPDDAMNDAAFDASITRALETAPELSISADFAARVALPLLRPLAASLTPRRYGRNAAIACMAVLMVLMFTLAHRAAGASPLWVSMESIYCAQFVLLALWLGMRQLRQS